MRRETRSRLAGVLATAVFGCSGAASGEAGSRDAAVSDAAGVAALTRVDCGAPDRDAALPSGALASRQAGPSAIAVDDTYVYWVNLGTGGGGGKSPRGFVGGQVMRCEKGGCGDRPTEIVSGITHDPDPSSAIAVDAFSVYFDDSARGIMACPKSGCWGSPTLLSPGDARQLVSDGTSLFWTAVDGTQVMKDAIAGGTATTLYSGHSEPYGIAVDAKDVYFTTFEGPVMKCAIGGCNNAPTTLVSGPLGATLLAMDATSVYWIVNNDESNAQIMKCAKTGCATPTVLATGRDDPLAIATDGTDVYWIELGQTVPPAYDPVPSSIFRCATTGCGGSPTLMIDQQLGEGTLAVDATHVYWSGDLCGEAQIMATAK